MNEIEVRRAATKDMNFIYSNWLNHYENHSSFARRVRTEIFMKWHRKVIGLIMARSTTEVRVATPQGDPDVLLGFIVTEQTDEGHAIHFAFVKAHFRKLGVARAMVKAAKLPEDKILFTHWTYDMDTIEKKFPQFIYHPYKL